MPQQGYKIYAENLSIIEYKVHRRMQLRLCTLIQMNMNFLVMNQRQINNNRALQIIISTSF